MPSPQAIPIQSALPEPEQLLPSQEILDQLNHLRALPRKQVLITVRRELMTSRSRTREEVLVSLCRKWSEMGEVEDAWEIAGVLTKRIRGKVARTLQLWQLDLPPALRDEVIEEITIKFYETLFDLSEASHFLEVRFWVCFDCDLLDIVRRRRKEQDNIPAFDQSESDSGQSGLASASQSLPQNGAPMPDPVTSVLVADALMSLPDGVRQAYVLKHLGGYPEESDREGGSVTIASLLNVSGRTVRNYLVRAEEFLARWRDGVGGQSYGGF